MSAIFISKTGLSVFEAEGVINILPKLLCVVRENAACWICGTTKNRKIEIFVSVRASSVAQQE
jgi:hypothetical protein